MNMETLAQEIATKTGQPIEITRAGLLVFGAMIGEVIGMETGPVRQALARANEILTTREFGKEEVT